MRPDATSSNDEEKPTVHSEGDRIVGKVNGSVVEGDWEKMKRFAQDILSEADKHKTPAQKIEEISGAWLRFSCSCCGHEREFEYVSTYRERGETVEEHCEHPDFDCETDDVTVEAFCPRHGTIPLGYDECDSCASNRAVMNR